MWNAELTETAEKSVSVLVLRCASAAASAFERQAADEAFGHYIDHEVNIMYS